MTGSKSATDPDTARRRRIRLAGFLAALLVALLLAVAGTGGPRRALFDLYQRAAPRDLSATQVHLVWIDPASLAVLGPWPWPRYHVARLAERIASARPRAIGFDALFPEPDRLRPEAFVALYPELDAAAAERVRALQSFDSAFGTVVGAAPVVLGRAGTFVPPEDPQGRPVDDRNLPVEALFEGAVPPDVARFPHAVANIPEIDEVAIGHGLLNGAPDNGGVVRRVPLVAEVAGQPMPGFALELARVATGTATVGLVGARRLRAVTLGGRRVPVGADGRMPIRFGEMPADRIHSAANVLRAGFPLRQFTGAIVIVALAAEGTQDVVSTPLRAEAFGSLVQAQAVDALLTGGWLSRPGWATAAEWAAALLLVTLLLWLGADRRRALPLLLAGLVLAFVTSVALFAGPGWLLDPLPAAATGTAAALGLFARTLVESRAEQERLRETLVQERVAAAEAEGELQAARAIQLGMLPARETLRRLDPRLDIAARLEPARSVGGDFYDAIALGDGRIGFIVGDVTGKGVPASLFMALSKALATSVMLRESPDLGAAAERLDGELSGGAAEMGVTMLIGWIDPATGEALLVNAGHENPLRIGTDGAIEEIAMEGGPPFCVVPFYPYPAERLLLAPGETLLLVTDGVTEAQDAEGQLFGRERLIETLRAVGGDAVAERTTSALLAAVRAFEGGAEATDDLTVLAIRYRGSEVR